MDLKGKSLPDWLEKFSNKSEHFPRNGMVDYHKRYLGIKEYLDIHVHPEIATMSLTFNDGIYLNKHGTEHINVVIERLSSLVDTGHSKNIELTPYEVYILLVATQLHDTGHIKTGRVGHEKASSSVIAELGNLIGSETAEKKMIYSIAEAHGGRTIDGRKDKIDLLPTSETILRFPIKAKMLAALLRLADELADDYTRASRVIAIYPDAAKGSEIYHRYASVIQSVVIDHEGGEIKIRYILDRQDLIKKYGKETAKDVIESIFLIDEIYARLYKMYLEFTYCMRFIPAINRLDTISAKIEFCDSNSLADFREPLMIKLTEKGYPKHQAKDLYDLCPETLFDSGKKINGEFLHNFVNTQ
jgi:hypothetical protein